MVVWEWTEDWYHGSYSGAPADGSVWIAPTDPYRVIRCGSFDIDAAYMRAAKRNSSTPGNRHASLGARSWRP